MSEAEPVNGQEHRTLLPVFISYATADLKQALLICKAIERRGARCWISNRDVSPGENYQEAIVHAIRNSRAMVLVFSAAANNSDEIKKELSLASRYRIPVLALRIESVEPSDAFAYELSTRQWIDAFEERDKAIDSLVRVIERIGDPEAAANPVEPSVARTTSSWRRQIVAAAAAGLLLLGVGAGVWWWFRSPPAAGHSMVVRLNKFRLLSSDLPPTLVDTVNAEIASAFNADGAITVSTASAPPPGEAATYALGGAIQREGDAIRVITNLTNERSGATLWSYDLNYDGNEVSRVPRHVAVDAGNVVRCGLFGASTYHEALPDAVLRDYMQFCQWHWDPHSREGRKALIPAQRVVAAVPDFSWGWAAVAGGYWKVSRSADNGRLAAEALASGIEAADRAISIDSRNSEALYIKSMLIARDDWVGRENLLKRAVAARRLDCGCEHHQYGEVLAGVGRLTEAVAELRQANDMLALYVYTPLSLADALVAAGKSDEAKPFFDAAIRLAPDRAFADRIGQYKATATGDVEAIVALGLPESDDLRTALLMGYRAARSEDAGEKKKAVQALRSLGEDQQNDAVALLLADLGASDDAFQIASRLASKEYPGPSIFWYPSMRSTLFNPGFPAVATRLRLFEYWKTTKSKPDVCEEKTPPPFCRMI